MSTKKRPKFQLALNANSSPRRMTSETPTGVWSATYYPFGEATTSGTNTHQFTGKELDSEMGLNYSVFPINLFRIIQGNENPALRDFCQRYYDPQIGRFMTLDPFGGYIELPQSQNRYAYCINNPLKYIDPLGLDYDFTQSPWYDPDWWNGIPGYVLEQYLEPIEVIGERYQEGEPTGLPLRDNSDMKWMKMVSSGILGSGMQGIGRLARDVGGGDLTIARMNAGENYADIVGIKDTPRASVEGSAASTEMKFIITSSINYLSTKNWSWGPIENVKDFLGLNGTPCGKMLMQMEGELLPQLAPYLNYWNVYVMDVKFHGWINFEYNEGSLFHILSLDPWLLGTVQPFSYTVYHYGMLPLEF